MQNKGKYNKKGPIKKLVLKKIVEKVEKNQIFREWPVGEWSAKTKN